MNNQHHSPSDKNNIYFDIQADMGFTKHMGGRRATEELLEMCHIQAGQYILEVGCGIGRTSCYIAKERGCRVMGVDISGAMVERAKQRAKRQGLETHQVEFRVADAQSLPFDDGVFDAVIDESVTAFVKDKQQAISEYVRVTKPGGYVGLNEVIWAKTPSPELIEYVSFIMAGADFLPSHGWKELFEGAGLQAIEVRNYEFNRRRQYIDELRQLDLREYATTWYRFLTQSITNPAYRAFIKDVMSAPKNISRFTACIGHGMFVGRK